MHADAVSTRADLPVLDLCCHGHKGLLHIGGAFGAGLQEGDANLISKRLAREQHQTGMQAVSWRQSPYYGFQTLV